MLANKKRINSVVQGPSLSRDECTVCIHPGRCRPSEETAHGRRSEGAPAGYANRNCCTLCTFAVGPEQNLVRLPRQGVPHSPVQKFPVGPPTLRDECAAEYAAVQDFFPLGGRPVAMVKENGGRE